LFHRTVVWLKINYRNSKLRHFLKVKKVLSNKIPQKILHKPVQNKMDSSLFVSALKSIRWLWGVFSEKFTA
jgi:hypothetical protein